MKWFIYILLLINLGLFVWHYQPNAPSQHNQLSDQLTRLVLVDEYEQNMELMSSENDSRFCYSLGPFTRKELFLDAKKKLMLQGIDVESRVSSERVRNGYWVMLPTSMTSNQAKIQIQKLKKLGVQDFFLVVTGEMKNAISLGVFSKPGLAKRRQDEIEKLGFNVKIKKITLPKRVYWLEWSRTSERQPSKLFLDKLLKQFDDIGQTERQCMNKKNS